MSVNCTLQQVLDILYCHAMQSTSPTVLCGKDEALAMAVNFYNSHQLALYRQA